MNESISNHSFRHLQINHLISWHSILSFDGMIIHEIHFKTRTRIKTKSSSFPVFLSFQEAGIKIKTKKKLSKCLLYSFLLISCLVCCFVFDDSWCEMNGCFWMPLFWICWSLCNHLNKSLSILWCFLWSFNPLKGSKCDESHENKVNFMNMWYGEFIDFMLVLDGYQVNQHD